MCYKRGCESKGKSIRRADMEGAFEDMLKTAQPSEQMIDLSRAMFKKAWDILAEHDAATKRAAELKLADTEKKIEKLLDQIIEAEGASVIKAYEPWPA